AHRHLVRRTAVAKMKTARVGPISPRTGHLHDIKAARAAADIAVSVPHPAAVAHEQPVAHAVEAETDPAVRTPKRTRVRHGYAVVAAAGAQADEGGVCGMNPRAVADDQL